MKSTSSHKPHGNQGLTHIKDLVADPANRRAHNPRNIGMLVDALQKVGLSRSIVVDEDGVILAGNGVVEAASEAGLTRLQIVEADGETLVAVRRRGLTDAQKRDLAIYDNRTAELATWNTAQFKDDLAGGQDFGAFFTPAELAAILGQAEPEGGLTDPDAVPQERPTGIVAGDLFELGRHRLLCGDSASGEAVARLMGDQRVDLLATSPPYTDQRDYKAGAFDWDAMMCGAFDAVTAFVAPDCHLLINLGLSHKDRKVDAYWDGWLEHCAQAGWPLFGWYVWDKGAGMPGDWSGRLAPAHEFVFHFNQQTSQANKWVGTLGRTDLGRKFRQKDGSVREVTSPDKVGQAFKVPDSVIRIGREMARGIHTENHPAVFPVQFPAFLITTWSEPGDAVLDPFLGSGSTLIACEQLDRQGFGMEIAPSYCQVIIDRWEAFTGQTAQKVGEAVR